MNQAEEECIYNSFEEESIDVDCLLVEPRSDQVSVSGVWCYEDANLGKSIKTEHDFCNLGVQGSNIYLEGVDTTNVNEVEVENLLTSNVSPCDGYLLDFGFDHGACIGNGNFQFPMKGSFGIQNSLTENFLGTEFQNYLTELKSLDKFDDFSKSFINEDTLPPDFSHSGLDVSSFCKDGPTNTSSVQDHGGIGVGVVTHKRSRKPTVRYIDESSIMNMKNAKKKREASSACKVKLSTVRRVKSQNEVKPKDKLTSSAITFDKAIQVPFSFQGPTECQKRNSSVKIENRIEIYSNESEDDSETTLRTMTGGNQRKLHRLWTVAEVNKLINGVSHFGVGKWTHIKKSLFSSSVHRTPVDLKDKWRNLLKASHAIKESMIEDDQKRSQPWRPLPKSILCRVRELASVYPYPRKMSRSKDVSSPDRIQSSKVPV